MSEIRTIAVVGGGVAGLTSAWLLSRRYNVTLFERNDYPGGHTHTVTVADGPDAGTPVDTGFIVMNHRNYPLFTRVLQQLDVPLRDSNMSFGYYDVGSGLQYSSRGANGLYAQRGNFFSPVFQGMVRDLFRFYRTAKRDLDAGTVGDGTLGEYLRRHGFGEFFLRHHILPMGAAIWSTPDAKMTGFPALSFLSFYRNHGLLGVREHPQWRTVVGGSHSYVKKMVAGFDVRLSSPVRRVSRLDEGVEIITQNGTAQRFDAVVLAAHADETLTMLADATEQERRLLGAWNYNRNHTLLHTDGSLMPPNRRARASWNFVREPGANGNDPLMLTYHMNRLQGLDAVKQYYVTLNPSRAVLRDSILMEVQYTHPMYTPDSMATQAALPQLNGHPRTRFCGSYFGYGFHEDAVRSAVAVASSLGVEL